MVYINTLKFRFACTTISYIFNIIFYRKIPTRKYSPSNYTSLSYGFRQGSPRRQENIQEDVDNRMENEQISQIKLNKNLNCFDSSTNDILPKSIFQDIKLNYREEDTDQPNYNTNPCRLMLPYSDPKSMISHLCSKPSLDFEHSKRTTLISQMSQKHLNENDLSIDIEMPECL